METYEKDPNGGYRLKGTAGEYFLSDADAGAPTCDVGYRVQVVNRYYLDMRHHSEEYRKNYFLRFRARTSERVPWSSDDPYSTTHVSQIAWKTEWKYAASADADWRYVDFCDTEFETPASISSIRVRGDRRRRERRREGRDRRTRLLRESGRVRGLLLLRLLWRRARRRTLLRLRWARRYARHARYSSVVGAYVGMTSSNFDLTGTIFDPPFAYFRHHGQTEPPARRAGASRARGPRPEPRDERLPHPGVRRGRRPAVRGSCPTTPTRTP